MYRPIAWCQIWLNSNWYKKTNISFKYNVFFMIPKTSSLFLSSSNLKARLYHFSHRKVRKPSQLRVLTLSLWYHPTSTFSLFDPNNSVQVFPCLSLQENCRALSDAKTSTLFTSFKMNFVITFSFTRLKKTKQIRMYSSFVDVKRNKNE